MKRTKLAYFLRGLGCGIVFVTITTGVSATHTSKENVTVERVELSKEEIIEKAKEYGMEEGVGMKVDQLFDATPSPEPSLEPMIEPTIEPVAEPEEDKSAKVEPSETPEATKTPAPKSEESITIRVKGGQTAGEVAKQLAKSGLVDDADKFHTYLMKHGYSKKIRAKQHTIQPNASYKAIAEELCN